MSTTPGSDSALTPTMYSYHECLRPRHVCHGDEEQDYYLLHIQVLCGAQLLLSLRSCWQKKIVVACVRGKQTNSSTS